MATREKAKIGRNYMLSLYDYWALQYLMTVNTNRTASDLIEEAVKAGVRYINENDTAFRKVKIPEKTLLQYAYITRETNAAWGLVKIKKHLDGWGAVDIVRYGLRKTLPSYEERFPVLRKLKEKYDK